MRRFNWYVVGDEEGMWLTEWPSPGDEVYFKTNSLFKAERFLERYS